MEDYHVAKKVIEMRDEIFADPNLFADGINAYISLSKSFVKAYASRRRTLALVMQDISSLARNVAPGAELHGRVKSIQSIWGKMRTDRLDSDQVLDTIGVRVITPDTEKCYQLVERIYRRFKVMEGEYDDYIKRPKPNGYRSLHTTILASDGHPVEVQVRTRQMHAFAKRGAAAHWLYKQRRAFTEMEKSPDLIDKSVVRFGSNQAGGITGGLTTGQDVVVRVAVKPTPTIAKEQHTVDKVTSEPAILSAITRRNPTIVPRVWPIVEAFTAIIPLDAYMHHRGYQATWRKPLN
jgi:ppGpp synthetase/RelA/SpoT-type nucleotidyltranferase